MLVVTVLSYLIYLFLTGGLYWQSSDIGLLFINNEDHARKEKDGVWQGGEGDIPLSWPYC